MNKSIVLALIASAAALATVPAHAGNVSWSVGVNLPGIVLPVPPVFVSAPVPVYAPERVYLQAQPACAPEYVYYRRVPAYVRPVSVVYPRYYPRYYQPYWHRDHDHWEGRGWHRD